MCSHAVFSAEESSLCGQLRAEDASLAAARAAGADLSGRVVALRRLLEGRPRAGHQLSKAEQVGQPQRITFQDAYPPYNQGWHKKPNPKNPTQKTHKKEHCKKPSLKWVFWVFRFFSKIKAYF